jgi:hypothetical protein
VTQLGVRRPFVIPSVKNGRTAVEVVMNRMLGRAVPADVAVKAVVRGKSPFPSVVPEDRSRVGDVQTIKRMHDPV